MLFWPVIIIAGFGFGAVYYDGDGSEKFAFPNETACELSLPGLMVTAKHTDDFMKQIYEATGGDLTDVEFVSKCITEPPPEFKRKHLDPLAAAPDNKS